MHLTYLTESQNVNLFKIDFRLQIKRRNLHLSLNKTSSSFKKNNHLNGGSILCGNVLQTTDRQEF